MGSCYYYLRATFPTALTADKVKSLTDFFTQAARAEETMGSFEELVKSYPAINHPEIKKVWDDLRISGQEDTESQLDVDEGSVTLRYSNEISHMSDWEPLSDVMKKVFGASHVSWTSDESEGVSPADVLDLQIYESIVDKILAQPKNSLPMFLGVHPALDGMIATKLSSKEE